MKLQIFFFAAIAAINTQTRSQICSFQNCDLCQTFLLLRTKNEHPAYVTKCKNFMKLGNCCQNYMRCDILTECVPRFFTYFPDNSNWSINKIHKLWFIIFTFMSYACDESKLKFFCQIFYFLYFIGFFLRVLFLPIKLSTLGSSVYRVQWFQCSPRTFEMVVCSYLMACIKPNIIWRISNTVKLILRTTYSWETVTQIKKLVSFKMFGKV